MSRPVRSFSEVCIYPSRPDRALANVTLHIACTVLMTREKGVGQPVACILLSIVS